MSLIYNTNINYPFPLAVASRQCAQGQTCRTVSYTDGPTPHRWASGQAVAAPGSPTREQWCWGCMVALARVIRTGRSGRASQQSFPLDSSIDGGRTHAPVHQIIRSVVFEPASPCAACEILQARLWLRAAHTRRAHPTHYSPSPPLSNHPHHPGRTQYAHNVTPQPTPPTPRPPTCTIPDVHNTQTVSHSSRRLRLHVHDARPRDVVGKSFWRCSQLTRLSPRGRPTKLSWSRICEPGRLAMLSWPTAGGTSTCAQVMKRGNGHLRMSRWRDHQGTGTQAARERLSRHVCSARSGKRPVCGWAHQAKPRAAKRTTVTPTARRAIVIVSSSDG